MSRGVVLWPDDETSAGIREIWLALEEQGVPSLASETHRLHQPHCSLSVAEHMPAEEALSAVGVVPSEPLTLHVESVSVFPPNGALVLACVVNDALLAEQRRVHRSVTPLSERPWPYFEANAWIPYITLASRLSPAQLALAIPLVVDRLPIRGTFDRGEVEDGTSGENWPAPKPD